MIEQDKESDLKLVREHVNKLMEHFDTVQIFASRHEQTNSGGTVHLSQGAGNWFARYGQVKEWGVREDQKSRLDVEPQDDANLD